MHFVGQSSTVQTSIVQPGPTGYEQLIDLKTVQQITGFGKSFIYRAIAAGTFPHPVSIGPKATRFALSEVQQWVRARIAERDAHGGSNRQNTSPRGSTV